MKRLLWILCVLTTLMFAQTASAALCTLAWKSNPESDIAGYKIYKRLVGQPYPETPAFVGSLTTVTCEQLGVTADGKRHFFVIRAYDKGFNLSDPSTEVYKDIPCAKGKSCR